MPRTYYKDNFAYENIVNSLKSYTLKDVVVLCIGSDKCIGDSLGPIIGELLEKNNVNIPFYGTLKKPVTALNITKIIKEIKIKHNNKSVIVIDACLGRENDIGFIHIRKGATNPGSGVGKQLPSFGHVSIVGVVDDFKSSNESLHTIRLNFVMRMAEVITKALVNVYCNEEKYAI